MKIRMAQERTGPRHDGRMWPPVGGELELGDDEGAAVCAQGWAVPVAATPKAETRPAPDGAEARAAAANAQAERDKAAASARADAQAAASAAADAPAKPKTAAKK